MYLGSDYNGNAEKYDILVTTDHTLTIKTDE